MSTRKQVQAEAHKLGADLDLTINHEFYDSEAWAPKGKKFKANNCHTVCTYHNAGFGIGAFYDQVLYDLKEGLVDCDETDCEHCE